LAVADPRSFFAAADPQACGHSRRRCDPNDPDRLAAICWACDEQKTRRDIREIARTKRLAEKHQDFLERQRDKVPGRRVASRKQEDKLNGELRRALPCGNASHE